MRLTLEKVVARGVGGLTLTAVGANFVADASAHRKVDPHLYHEAGGKAAIRGEQVEDEGSLSVTFSVQETKKSWDKKDAKRFKELAIKRALGTATAEDQKEFLFLQNARREHEIQLSEEQILSEYRRANMLRDLEAFFEKYAISTVSHQTR